MQALSYTVFETVSIPRPVERLAFLERCVTGKYVFDLGALDETALASKRVSGSWLHTRLCKSAARVVGIDNSLLIPEAGLETAHGGKIVRADVLDLDSVIDAHGVPDVIVAGELIEHLPNASAFLASLRGNARLRGTTFVFSTPNACCWHNFLVGLAGYESMHVDHLQIYSYKTLRTLFKDVDIELVNLVPCRARFSEMLEHTTGLKRASVMTFQRMVNALEFVTPILSAGWVGVARL